MSLRQDGALAAVLSAAVDAMVVIDHKGIIQQVSASVERLFEYSPLECVGKNISMFMPAPDRHAHDGYIANYLNGGRPKIIGIGRKTTGRKKTGQNFPMHLSVGEFEFAGETYFVGICHDLSDYNQAIEKLHQAEKRYKDIVESQKHFICRIDKLLNITFANTSFLKALGMPYQEVVGSQLKTVINKSYKNLSLSFNELFSDPDLYEINIKIEMKTKGPTVITDWSFRKVEDQQNDSKELQGIGIDVSEKEAAILKAEYMRSHDQLTGLLKADSLSERFNGLAHHENNYSIYHLDLVRFGQINQRHGYNFGDQVLVDVTTRIQKILPKGSLFSRAGGDEFIAISPIEDQAYAIRLGEELLAVFFEPYSLADQNHLLDTKIGVALFPADAGRISRAIELSEVALKDAKANGGAIVFYEKESHADSLRRIIIEQELKAAFKNNSIDIYLQPKIDLGSRKTCSYEALARWKHAELGHISPAEFVPIAEMNGLGSILDFYVLRAVAKILSDRLSEGQACIPVAVNITAAHFSDINIFDYLSDILKEYSLPPDLIELEITERAILSTCAIATENFKRLRQAGIKISIDDFGTGYSSLSYLKKLEVDEIKIDKSFIDDIEERNGEVVIQAIMTIAQAYGLTVTAEGVETAAQARILTDMGCTLGQGYFFSRPIPWQEAFM